MKRAPFLGALVLFVVVLALRVGAEDERPTEIPYANSGEFPQLSPDYKMTNHRVVLITDQSLNPQVVTLSEGQLVAWISYSAAESVVVFEREAVRNRLAAGLDAELDVGVPQGEALPVDGAQAHPVELGVDLGELGDVGGDLAVAI